LFVLKNLVVCLFLKNPEHESTLRKARKPGSRKRSHYTCLDRKLVSKSVARFVCGVCTEQRLQACASQQLLDATASVDFLPPLHVTASCEGLE